MAPKNVSFGPQVGQTFIGGHRCPHLGKPWLFAPQSEEGNRLFWGSPQATLKFDESLQGLKEFREFVILMVCYNKRIHINNLHTWECPSGPEFRTLHFHCLGSDFDS